MGMEGEVEVDWVISGTNAAQDFQNSTGTAVFEDVSQALVTFVWFILQLYM